MIDQRRLLYSNLKFARLEKNWKQRDVSKKLGLSSSALSAIETGKRKLDAIELFQLSQLYDKPVDWFFTEHRTDRQDQQHARKTPQKIPGLYSDYEDPIVREAIHQIIYADQTLQKRACYGVIGFLSQR